MRIIHTLAALSSLTLQVAAQNEAALNFAVNTVRNSGYHTGNCTALCTVSVFITEIRETTVGTVIGYSFLLPIFLTRLELVF